MPQKVNLEVLHRICTQYYKHMIKIQCFVFLVVCWLQTQVKCQQWEGSFF